MSITNSLYIGMSGLDAHGDAISIVGDNIANASTIGYKSSTAEFSDMLGGELGSQRLGGGVKLGGSETNFTQGAIQQTGNPLDLAIQGGGFFAVKGTQNGQTGQFYTRDGQFQIDNNGYVTDSQGLRLQGYAINSAGVTSQTLGDLPIGARQSPPTPTTTATMDVALDSNAPVLPTFDPTNISGTSNFQTSQTTYDSLGNAHQVQMSFHNDGGGNWDWHATVDGKEVTGGTPGTQTQIAGGTLQFNTNGTLQAQTTTSSSANFVGATPNQVVKFNFGDDIASGGTGLAGSQMNAQANGSNLVSADVDGHSAGNLSSVNITSDGKIEGIYDNGDQIEIAQVGLAQFANNEGLARTGGGLMTTTQDSGSAIMGAAGVGSRGSITSGALEASNVDVGSELITLIAYQRAFEANSKTVTTADQMMTDVVNLKQ